MDQRICYISGGGLIIRFFLLYPETREFFKSYLIKCEKTKADLEIQVSPAFMEENRWLVNDDESLPFLEFQSLMLKSGNELLLHDRALFHGAALLWKDHVWIFTAPSGTGKTTQFRRWRDILGKKIKVINGDKPLLECREDGTIWVYSSPWRGKEKFGAPRSKGKLGGIILLKQEEENRIKLLEPAEAVFPLFTEFVSFPENEEQLACQARILSKMLDAVPVWELQNRGDETSALLTIETLKDYLEEKDYE